MIEVVFFDIGATLLERDASSGAVRPFASSRGLLSAARDALGLRVGVITNLGRDLTDEEGLALLRGAGLAEFLDPAGFVSDRAAAPPSPMRQSIVSQRVGTGSPRAAASTSARTPPRSAAPRRRAWRRSSSPSRLPEPGASRRAFDVTPARPLARP